MPRKSKEVDIDPENIYALQNQEEVQDFIDIFTNEGLDAYRSAYSDLDYDTDNYGYGDY